MQVIIICEKDSTEKMVEGDYSHVRAEVTNFLIDHNH